MLRRSVQRAIGKIDTEIKEEEGTLAVLRERSRQTKVLFQFQRRRSTNAAFSNWYGGRINALYAAAFGITVRFCRIAERGYQFKFEAPAPTFIKPTFDRQFRCLLSGQSLMLDLQRMELASIDRPKANN